MINGDYEGLFEMTERFKRRLWPNLTPANHKLTSEPTIQENTISYNCVAWANHIDNEDIDFSLDEDGLPIQYPDLSCWNYIDYFEKNGFELCETPDYEEGFEKIALYERDGKTFEHVARQLGQDLWTSKLGEWEDIEHTTLESLESANNYGFPRWFMKRKRG